MLLYATYLRISFSTSLYSFSSFLNIIILGIYLRLYIAYLVSPYISVPRVISPYSYSILEVLFNVATKTSREAAVFIQFKKAFRISTLRDIID